VRAAARIQHIRKKPEPEEVYKCKRRRANRKCRNKK
jgi:hypothetical protein